jgi:hypothetical protein
MIGKTSGIALALVLAAAPAFAQRAGSAAGVAGQVITPNPGMTIRGPNTGVRDATPDAGVSSAAPNTGIAVGSPNTGLSGGAPPGDSGTAGAIVGNTGGDTGLRTTPGFGTGIATGAEMGASGATIVGNTGSDTGLRSTSTGTTDINGNGIGAAPSSPPGTPPGILGPPGVPLR